MALDDANEILFTLLWRIASRTLYVAIVPCCKSVLVISVPNLMSGFAAK